MDAPRSAVCAATSEAIITTTSEVINAVISEAISEAISDTIHFALRDLHRGATSLEARRGLHRIEPHFEQQIDVQREHLSHRHTAWSVRVRPQSRDTSVQLRSCGVASNQ